MTTSEATAKRKPGRPPKAATPEPAEVPAKGQRGGARPGAGRKNAVVEAATNDAHIIYAKARAKKEAHLAQMAELEYKIKSGEYLPRDEVRQGAATAFATIAQSLRSIPDNLERKLGISPEVAEQVGLLIDDAMADLAEQLERMHLENS